MRIAIPFLQIFIAAQCALFIAYLVVGRKIRPLANKLLLGLLSLLAVHMLVNLINQHLMVGIWPDFALGFGLFYGPIVYLYTQALIHRDFRLSPRELVHFLPGIVVGSSVLLVDLSTLLYAGLIFGSLFAYILLSYQRLVHYRRVLLSTQSNFDRLALRWLSQLLGAQAVVLIVNIVSVLLESWGYRAAGTWAEISLFASLLLLVNITIFKGLEHPILFQGISLEDEAVAAQSRLKYGANALEEEERAELIRRLDAFMNETRIYCDPDLSLARLARKMGLSTRHISQAINAGLAINFSDFVNRYRVDEAVRQLTSDKERARSIIEVQLASGFNTKSNFNRAFKKFTQSTPSEFRKHNRA